MNSLLRKFPNDPPRPSIVRADGLYLELADGRKILDATSGYTTYAVLGYSHPQVLDAMRTQMGRFCHVDYNIWTNPMLEELATVLLSRAPKGLNKVYFSGNSGTEATEGAMKLSYQTHWDAGKKNKTWFISRVQSFHGATLQAIAVSELPILHFYEQIQPTKIAKIPQHHPLYSRRENESLDDYARRGARDLEDKILEIGPENVAAFIGETMLGTLVGDVPPAPNYWKYMRDVCHKYDVHLILDEVYCGLGRSGEIYCCSHDGIVPDFVCVGKALGAGYAPLSAVITSDHVEKVISKGQGRIQHGHTHQGYSLGVAAALAVQKIIHTDSMLEHINKLGDMMRAKLSARLGRHPMFRDLRGRGVTFSLEYKARNNHGLGLALAKTMEENHNILINAKWHRVSFTPAFTMTLDQANLVIDAFVDTFEKLAPQFY